MYSLLKVIKNTCGIFQQGNQILSNIIFEAETFNGKHRIMLEKHTKKICTCSYCVDTKYIPFGFRIPKNKHHGWFSTYVKNFKHAYYLRFTLPFPDPLDTLSNYIKKRYVQKEIEDLLGILSNPDTDTISKNTHQLYPYIRRGYVPNIIKFLKLKFDQVPLYINHDLVEIRRFARWRLNISK